MKVLITSPSLDEKENVSGISTMISSIIEKGGTDFVHFAAGRKDGEKFDLDWLVAQARLPFAFRNAIAHAKPDIIHINTSFEPRSIIRDLVLAKAAGSRPIVLHMHGGRFVMQDFPNGVLASLAGMLLSSASRVIVLSEPEAENLLKRTPGLQVRILANAVVTERFPETERERGTKTIVYLGRLDEAKGLGDMTEAARLLVGQGFKFRFSCYGAGPDLERFSAAMSEALGESFHYGGIVSGDQKVRALQGGDIFLMPSRFEGLPLALLEAMAAGCVPVVSNRGSIPTVIDDGRNGFLVEPGDLTQIVGKLKFLLSEGEAGWNQLRENARRTVRETHDFGSYSNALQKIYREALGRKP